MNKHVAISFYSAKLTCEFELIFQRFLYIIHSGKNTTFALCIGRKKLNNVSILINPQIMCENVIVADLSVILSVCCSEKDLNKD